MKRFLLLMGLFVPVAAFGHPMGNVSINKYARVTPVAGALHLRYVLDMAELPTLTERRDMDKDGDGEDSDAETQAYLADRIPGWLSNCKAMVDGKPVTWELVSKRLDFIPGDANLMTMRIEMNATAPLPSGAEDLKFADLNYKDRIGWKQVLLDPMGGAHTPSDGTAAPADATDALRRYPAALVAAPPQVTTAEARVHVPPPHAAAASKPKSGPKASTATPVPPKAVPPKPQQAATGPKPTRPTALTPKAETPHSIHSATQPAKPPTATRPPSVTQPATVPSTESRPVAARTPPVLAAVLAACLALGAVVAAFVFHQAKRPGPSL